MRFKFLALSCGLAALLAGCGSDNGPDGSIDLTEQ